VIFLARHVSFSHQPLISIRIGAELMLIEGYARSLLWFRSPTKPLLIWQPVE
jgi:hypothetical protein